MTQIFRIDTTNWNQCSCFKQGNWFLFLLNPAKSKELPIFLPLTLLDETDGYYYHELIGYNVSCEGNVLGQVSEIYDQERNPLFAFLHEGHEVLVPFQDQFMKSVDKQSKTIDIILPDGYLDIYMETK